jgi:hypothetical protein
MLVKEDEQEKAGAFNDAEDRTVPGANAITVPLKALAIDGAAPQQGETVTVETEFTVVSVDGESAKIAPKSINGSPVGTDESGEMPEDMSDEKLGGLLKEAGM